MSSTQKLFGHFQVAYLVSLWSAVHTVSLTLPQNITEKPYDCFLFITGILLASNAVVGEDDLWVRVFVLVCVCT